MVLGGCVVFGCLGVVVAALIGLLVGFIAHGPIAINGLGPRIASALDERFGQGAKFTLGTTSIVQRGFGLTLSIDGLTIQGPDGAKFLYAPRAEVSVDTGSLLLGKVVPKRLEVLGLELRMVLLKDGSLALAAGQGATPFYQLGKGAEPPPAANSSAPTANATAGAPAPGAAAPGDAGGPQASATAIAAAVAPRRAVVMRQAAKGIRYMFDAITSPKGPIAAVDRLGIKGGRLVIDDLNANAEVVYKDLDLEFNKVSGGTALALSAAGPSQRWSIEAEASGAPGAARRFSIDLKNFSQDEIELIAGTHKLPYDTDCSFGVSFKVGLNPNDTLSEAVGHFHVGSGFLRLEDPDQEPMLIDHADADFHWNGASRRIELDRGALDDGTTKLAVAGSITPPLNEGEPWAIALITPEPGVMGPDRLGDQPVSIDHGQFVGHLYTDRKVFIIDRLSFASGNEGGIALEGRVDWENGPRIRFGASIDPTTVRVAKRMWPAFVAAPVRTWILAHFDGGTLTRGTMRVDYDADALLRMRSDRAPPDDSVAIDFSIEQARLSFLPGVPPIEDMIGGGHLTGRKGRFTLTSGAMDANGRKIGFSDGVFSILNADVHPTPAEFSARLVGSVEAITSVLSRPALRPYAAMPLNPATLKGDADGHIDDTLFLGDHVSPKDNKLRMSATITNFSADKLIGKEKLENATVSIAVDPNGMKASGQGRLFGAPATFDLARNGEKPTDAVVNLTLDDAARAKLGLSAIPGLAGPMTARVATTLGAAEPVKAQVEVDLAKTTVTEPLIGLSKPAGRPAKVAMNVTANDNRIAIDPITLDVGALQGRGAIELGPDNTFQGARFSSLKISAGDDMKVEVSKAEDTLKLVVRGSTIDARPFLHALTQTSSDGVPMSKAAKADRREIEAIKGIDIDLKSSLLTGFNKQVMSGVDLHMIKRGSQIRQFSVDGRFGRVAVAGSMTANQRLRVTSQDAGALLSFIDLYRHMEGGQLSASMQVGDETLDGNLEIEHFVLRDEPAMRKLVAQSIETTPRAADGVQASRGIDANAVTFTRLKVNFQRDGSHLDLKDATMYGSAIGLSVEGWLDYAHDRVGMNGTFVPAYALNNLFSQVPVLGFFLGGDRNEGLFAITFRLSGLLGNPTLAINPLSSIAPGFLRKIFGVLDVKGGPNEDTAPAPAR